MKYKLVACDYDGTIYDGTKVSEETIEKINSYKAKGGKFVLSTGRIYQSIRREAAKLGIISGEVIAFQGSGIFDLETDAVLHQVLLKNEIAIKAIKAMEAEGEVCHLYMNYEYFVAKPNGRTDNYSKYCSVPPTFTDQPLSEFLEKCKIDVNKVVIIVPSVKMPMRLAQVRELLGDAADVSQSSAEYIEIVSNAAGKGNAVEWLMKKYGLQREEVVCIGDAENDVTMLRFGGLGAAMGNASDYVKSQADIVIDSVQNGGVAKLLDKIICGYNIGG